MIVNALLAIIDKVIAVVVYPIAILPDATLPDSVNTAIQSSSMYYSTANQVFPMSTLLLLLFLLISIEGFVFIYKTFRLAGKHVPGIS